MKLYCQDCGDLVADESGQAIEFDQRLTRCCSPCERRPAARGAEGHNTSAVGYRFRRACWVTTPSVICCARRVAQCRTTTFS